MKPTACENPWLINDIRAAYFAAEQRRALFLIGFSQKNISMVINHSEGSTYDHRSIGLAPGHSWYISIIDSAGICLSRRENLTIPEGSSS
jgi:hypothetical protein